MTDYSNWLLTWFKERTPNIQLAPDENYFDAGAIDSLGIIELIEDLENTFSIEFTQTDFQDRRFVNIAGLTAIIKEKI